jgi:hypothetical protein
MNVEIGTETPIFSEEVDFILYARHNQIVSFQKSVTT